MEEKKTFGAIGDFENFRALEEKLWLLSFKQYVDNILVPPVSDSDRKRARMMGLHGPLRSTRSSNDFYVISNEIVCYFLLKLIRTHPENRKSILLALEQSKKVDFGPKVFEFAMTPIVQDFFSINPSEMTDAEMFTVYESFQQTFVEQNVLRQVLYEITVALCVYKNCHMIIDIVNVLYPVSFVFSCKQEQEVRFQEGLQFCKPIIRELSHGMVRESGDKVQSINYKICDTSLIPFQDVNRCMFICGFDSVSEILKRYKIDVDAKDLEAIHINYNSSLSCHLFDGITSIVKSQKDVARLCADFYASWNTDFTKAADYIMLVQKMFSELDLESNTNSDVFVRHRSFFFEMEKKGIHLLYTLHRFER